MFILLRNQCCNYILSVLFSRRNRCALYFGRALYFVRRRPSLLANSGLSDDFPQNIFPTTPPENGNVGWGTRALSESGFKVGENLLPGRSAAGEI
jgi:hypothetical protein